MSKSFIQFFFTLAFISQAVAFLNSGAARSMIRATSLSMKMDVPKAIAAMTPAFVSLPVFANDVIMSTLPVSNEVTFAAYLAVLLGTFVPVTFLIVLYTQSEARKSGLRGSK